jgi:hypothetical protein
VYEEMEKQRVERGEVPQFLRIANSLPVLNQKLSEATMAPRLPVLNIDKISTYMTSGTDEGEGDKTGSKIDKNQNRKKTLSHINSLVKQQWHPK